MCDQKDTDGLLDDVKENVHKFSRSDEAFFCDAVRLSPFPAEALAQLQTLATSQNFVSISIADAARWIFEKGRVYFLCGTYGIAPTDTCDNGFQTVCQFILDACTRYIHAVIM